MAESQGRHVFNFIRNYPPVLTQFFQSFKISALLEGIQWYLGLVLSCIFLMNNGTEHFHLCLVTIHISFLFVKYLSKYFAILKILILLLDCIIKSIFWGMDCRIQIEKMLSKRVIRAVVTMSTAVTFLPAQPMTEQKPLRMPSLALFRTEI